MWQIGVMILIGALAFRSASFITRASQRAEGIRSAVTLRPYAGLAKWYVILGFPLAFVNGYLIEFSWIDCVVVGIGTLLITLVRSAGLTAFFDKHARYPSERAGCRGPRYRPWQRSGNRSTI